MDILEGVDGIAVMTLTTEDVVRHRLVKEIIKAYDKVETEERLRKEQRRREKEGLPAETPPTPETPETPENSEKTAD